MINLRSMLDTKCFGSSLVPAILLLIAPHSSQAQLSVDPEGKLHGQLEFVDPLPPWFLNGQFLAKIVLKMPKMVATLLVSENFLPT